MKLYCQACSQPTEYAIAKPKFCSACGASFTAALTSPAQAPTVSPLPPKPAKAATPTSRVASAPIVPDDEDDEDNTPVQIPQLDSLAVDITPFRPNSVKIGDIAGTVEQSESVQRDVLPKMSRKKFLEEFRKEAGTQRQK
jgi:hypothetical protein